MFFLHFLQPGSIVARYRGGSTMSYQTAEEAEAQRVKVLGPELGPVFHALYNQCAWLQFKWHQFTELFNSGQERIDLLNRAAPLFFGMAQDDMGEAILLSLTRLTDPPDSRGRPNLTIKRLPRLVADELRPELQQLVDAAEQKVELIRPWRNKYTGHIDYNIATKQAEPLSPPTRDQVNDAVNAICTVVERISSHYFHMQSGRIELMTRFQAGDAYSLIEVLQHGVKARDAANTIPLPRS
jgi:hypothetical protein